MKLYATMTNPKGNRKSMGHDGRILIELAYGNKVIGTIGLYSIIDDKVDGYRVVWDANDGKAHQTVIGHEERQKLKGETRVCADGKHYHAEGVKYPYCYMSM